MHDDQIIQYILASVVLVLFLAVVLIWFLSHAQKKITAAKIKEQENNLEFQRELLINTVKTKEQERTRIARELHDGVSSQLGIANLNLHVLKNKINWDEENARVIDQIKQSVIASAERTRNLSHELMPLVFSKYGIHHAMKELQDSVNLTNVLDLTIDDDFLIAIKDDFKLLHIYRIMQELINNTIKYAKASEAKVRFVTDRRDLILRYSDDGIGFDPDEVGSGLGISNIKTRVALLDGELTLESTPGRGMTATIKFPNHD